VTIPHDRRRSARRIPAPGEPLRRVRSRTGHELDLVDISQIGALIEGRVRLLPNTRLDVHLVLKAGRTLIRCRVVRAYVCHVEADLVRYRVGLAFEQTVDTSGGYHVPSVFPRDFQAAGTSYPDAASDHAVRASNMAPG
jgi:hypothetical protein